MVHFVGAGPGAPDLITLRGVKAIRNADVVIYAGSLVNPELLNETKPGCKVHDSSFLTLKETISLMQEAEQEGKETVRLHTGDPSLYGAVREQMEELEKLGIPYDVTPGVSSCLAAAASLGMEYTLPGITQTLVLTRIDGRTPVPEAESIEKLAGLHASMVFFLSAGQTERLQERLLRGGCPEDTPAAIVKRASWPDEETILCTVGSLHRKAQEHGIRKTALILVGEAVSRHKGSIAETNARSRLYAPDFRTGLRDEASGVRVHIISFTDRGDALAEGLREALRLQDVEADLASGREVPLQEWTNACFKTSHTLFFIGAAGIAVRAIAPLIRDKATDPAVIAADEEGRYWIPILSGHLGGANEMARMAAGLTGGEAVVTTATDVRKRFAVDEFARDNRLSISSLDGAKAFTASLLAGHGVKLIISPEEMEGFHLIPRSIILGVGCRRGKKKEEILDFIYRKLDELGLSPHAVAILATVDAKKEEAGLIESARELMAKLMTFTPGELTEAGKGFEGLASSPRVKEAVGTDNVCEKAALAAGAERLLLYRTAENGITLAVGIAETRLRFNET